MLANRIRSLRTERALTQKALAESLGVSQQTIGSWEVGRTAPDPDTIIRLARFFNCSAEYLLGMTNKRTETVEDHLLDQEINSAIYKLAIVTSSNPATYKKEFPPQTAELLRQELDNLLTSEEIDLEMTPDDFDRLVHEIDDPDFKQDFLDALNRVIALQAMAALKSNQLQITVSDDSIFHGKPEKLQDHVDNLDKMEPALVENLLKRIANSAELFPRSTKKPPDINITIIDEKILEDPPPPKKRDEQRFRINKGRSVATEPAKVLAFLQQLGRIDRLETNEVQNRLGMLSPDDQASMLRIIDTVAPTLSALGKLDNK